MLSFRPNGACEGAMTIMLCHPHKYSSMCVSGFCPNLFTTRLVVSATLIVAACAARDVVFPILMLCLTSTSVMVCEAAVKVCP